MILDISTFQETRPEKGPLEMYSLLVVTLFFIFKIEMMISIFDFLEAIRQFKSLFYNNSSNQSNINFLGK